MKKYLLITLIICGNLVAFPQSSSEQIAQEKATLPKPYHPEEDGLARIEELILQANKKYIYYHLNYSPENKNEKAFAKYGNPGEKYGYPAFLVLDKKGYLLATRKTEDMEAINGYDKDKVKKFLQGRLK